MGGKKILNFSIIAISFTVLTLALFTFTIPVLADGCTVTLSSGANIQTAVDAASGGDVICLDGTFHQSVSIGPEDTPITLSGSSGVLDGSGPADAGTFLTPNWAILLQDGVSDVTIENLEIKNYAGLGGGGQGNAIQAWEVSTSDIEVRNNWLHDNKWNGILVGSEGGFVHDNWEVEDNTVEDNGFVGIELTNCNDCEIEDNDVHDSGFADIVIQARNTNAGSGLVTIEDVKVEDNTVGSSVRGIQALSFTGDRNSFAPISGASSLLKDVKIKGNTVTDSTAVQIQFDAFNNAATNENGKIEDNTINCVSGVPGIKVLERGLSGQTGEVKNVKVKENTIDSDCDPAITFEGDTEELKIGE